LSALCLERLLENGVDEPEIETRPNMISWFDIEDPDGNEMRWYQVLTSDTQVTATTTMKKGRAARRKEKEEALPLS